MSWIQVLLFVPVEATGRRLVFACIALGTVPWRQSLSLTEAGFQLGQLVGRLLGAACPCSLVLGLRAPRSHAPVGVGDLKSGSHASIARPLQTSEPSFQSLNYSHVLNFIRIKI